MPGHTLAPRPQVFKITPALVYGFMTSGEASTTVHPRISGKISAWSSPPAGCLPGFLLLQGVAQSQEHTTGLLGASYQRGSYRWRLRKEAESSGFAEHPLGPRLRLHAQSS